jgi:transposase
MSETRAFGTEISANRQRNREFNLEQRGAMCEAVSRGDSYTHVTADFHTTRSTVQAIWRRWQEDGNVQRKPRSGRPRKLSEAEIRYITILLKRDRKITWLALCGAVDGRVNPRTIRRALQREYKRKWKSAQRIEITEETAEARLQFCYNWEGKEQELVEVCAFEVRLVVKANTRNRHSSRTRPQHKINPIIDKDGYSGRLKRGLTGK